MGGLPLTSRQILLLLFFAFPLTAFLLRIAFSANIAAQVAIISLTSLAALWSLISMRWPAWKITAPTLLIVLIACEVASLVLYWQSATMLATTLALIVFQILVFVVTRPLRVAFHYHTSEFYEVLARYLVALLAVATVVSFLMNQYSLEFAHPFAPFMGPQYGERFKLLAMRTDGHSIAAEAATILAVCLILSSRRINFLRALLLGLCAAILLASLARISLIYLLIIGLVAATRHGMLSSRLYSAVSLTLVVIMALAVYTPLQQIATPALADMQEVFSSVRLLGQGGDLTNGRDVLNHDLAATFAESPWVGVGYDHSILRFGTDFILRRGYEGDGATSESALRLFVARGLLVGIPIVIFYAAGFFAGSGKKRLFTVSIATIIFTRFVLNGGLERMTGVLDIWFFALASLAFVPRLAEEHSTSDAGSRTPKDLLRRSYG